MEKFGKAQSFTRLEDVRFLKGEGRYIDDVAPENAYFGYFLRSQVAHGTIAELGLDDARDLDGVHLILTADDLEAAGVALDMWSLRMTNVDGTKGAAPKRPPLAKGKVRFVGEAVAFIVADSIDVAKDAAEMIELDIDELDPHLEIAPGGPLVHDDVPDNLAYDFGIGDRDATETAIADAAHVVTCEVADTRVAAVSMEPRGAFAEPIENGRMHFAFSGQGVWGPKGQIAKALGMDEDDLKVTTPDVGGGFGMKGQMYPEYIVLVHAARVLNHPVRWIADRSESLLTDNAGRALTHTATLAFDTDFRITAYKVESLSDLGAYNGQFGQGIQAQLFSRVLTGVYDIQTAWLNTKGIYTNTVQVDAYRGAGRPEAIYLLETMMDRAARALGIDPWDIRRRNFIAPDAFPYDTIVGETYDVGEFNKVLSRVADEADLQGYAKRHEDSEKAGKLRGIGLCYYIESILGSPEEDATLEFTEDGRALLYVGTQSNGQGHETVYAKFLSDQTGIPVDRIEIVQGDSDRIARGGGTGGSRSVTVQNNVTLQTVAKVVEGFSAFLAEVEEVAVEDVSFDDEVFRIKGSNLTPTMLDAAALAKAKGRDDLLRTTETAKLPARSFPNGAHVAEVEVDPETGVTRLDRYTVTDDFGNMINPLLVEGQVHGGVVQGMGQLMMEQLVTDEDGQVLTASFMDYAMPRADNTPFMKFTTEPVPSTANVMGMKGCGEAGTVGSMAAIGNAITDALWQRGVRDPQMPYTPLRVWQMLRDAE
ncbi:carbon-monoxide dehydrogenase large subunit [Maritimibacter alkaliphilus HTCC2654]|uniref:Xanthine dehydrogenase family protein, large subunit n=1 Tax=Maritimibacter alkaliphilus HTCC2654 TaxID=314271 RepID=A3VHG9_9RHOB|nr:xanthine dehydrogenase family protein molybdopterin-binding subunit [Maritimibacter alkaliphilus]EAQ12160.1 xanthine dehydrogenase family protein, large subunit [Rhodobacterales bacterium HTCC2654] [Maritimibacter alkaliphilus HTCC2654]TYP85546.1 carbon-monoxide dehydrogenase large subunit [Maritimibacter alkaliphilus HTCC2654]